jgi:tRNA-Thr(GGU) m(6)t(6)A37 methyltransferase TsaA
MPDTFEVRRIGTVRSTLVDRGVAPNQGDEGAPDAWLEFDEDVVQALVGLALDDRIIVITWLHEADRSVLVTHPRDDRTRQPAGVFATRSPDRPNPLGLHETRIVSIDERRIRVSGLEAIDGTPIVDLKPVLGAVSER